MTRSPIGRIQPQRSSLVRSRRVIHHDQRNGAPAEAGPPPQLNVLAQYTKDLSFENPNAPASLAPQAQQPAINIQINVSANNIAENEYEVTLSVEGKAETAGKMMFSFDLAYAGVFRIVNVPKETCIRWS